MQVCTRAISLAWEIWHTLSPLLGDRVHIKTQFYLRNAFIFLFLVIMVQVRGLTFFVARALMPWYLGRYSLLPFSEHTVRGSLALFLSLPRRERDSGLPALWLASPVSSVVPSGRHSNHCLMNEWWLFIMIYGLKLFIVNQIHELGFPFILLLWQFNLGWHKLS